MPEMGARPLRRVIEQYMEDPLAEKLLLHPNEEKHYVVNAGGDKLIVEEKQELATTNV